jgi:hypothetical protein
MCKRIQSFFRRTIALTVIFAVQASATATFAGPPQHSVARQWNEELLEAIRKDQSRPTVHARNLWHVSVAMWDAWAAYGDVARTFLHHERVTAADLRSAREEAISYAAYRIIAARFASSPGAAATLPALKERMAALGFDIDFTSLEGGSPAALGNRIARTVLDYGLEDGSNEANGYKSRFYKPVNEPLVPGFSGNPTITDPNRWQPLALSFFVDQSGNVVLEGYPEAVTPEWGQVRAFALASNDLVISPRDGFDYWTYHDPGPQPLLGGAGEDYYKWGFEMNIAWSAHHDTSDGVMIDISPASIGNATPHGPPDPADYESFYRFEEGGDQGTGYPFNPITGQPYVPQIVPRADYTRSLAEFWADGPKSETPPGHWFTIANYVSDHPLFQKRLGGDGPVLKELEWDVKVYLVLGGAMHDTAVSIWGIKGRYDSSRPISAIRHMASLGQSSDPSGPSYHPHGLTLRPGLIEIITAKTSAPGQRHAHLAGNEGKIAIRCWRGPPFIQPPDSTIAGAGWILGENWWPYQMASFVTPPFPGYVSGHSGYSRAGATIMTLMTGSEYFPGGLAEFHCPKDQFLRVERGPSVDVSLQWAKYADASDQCSLSRIWTGFHPPFDDLPSRIIGQKVGEDAFALALAHFNGTKTGRFHRGDVTDDGVLDISDAVSVLGFLFLGGERPGCMSAADANTDGEVDISDGIALLDFLFVGGRKPATPGPPDGNFPCGMDPAGSAYLGCDHYDSCR